jgi:hypothetical protein
MERYHVIRNIAQPQTGEGTVSYGITHDAVEDCLVYPSANSAHPRSVWSTCSTETKCLCGTFGTFWTIIWSS